MSKRARRGFTRKRLIAVGQHVTNLNQHRLRRQIPVLVQLFQKQRKVVGGKSCGWRRVSRVPVFGRCCSRIQRRQRHHRKLRGAKRRVESLINRITFPTALRPLCGQHGFHRARHVLVGLRAAAGLSQGQHRVVGDEVRRLGLLVEWIRPPALGSLILVELVNQTADLRRVFLAVQCGQKLDLPIQVDDVLRLVWQRQGRYVVALRQPLGIVGLVVNQVECLPTLQSNLKRAYVGLAPVSLVAGQHGQALVMNLQVARIGYVEVFARRIVSDILFKRMCDEGQTAGNRASGVNHAHPVGIGFSVERPGVVVNAIGEKLEPRALGWRIAVLDRFQITARGELRGMAGDAELGF